MDKTLGLLLLCCSNVQFILTSTQLERVWPLSNSTEVDIQSSPFGPRLLNYRYDFHRGVDIPTPEGTHVYAIDDGMVRRAGRHQGYTDPLVQIEHRDWAESAGTRFYSNYMHMQENTTVTPGQQVTKGQLIGYSSHSASGFEHLHFEIRVGRPNSVNCCNPWKYLSNANNSYNSFTANVSLASKTCKATVNISVPNNQLTFNRIELHVDYGRGDHMFKYDMCQENLIYNRKDMDKVKFRDNLKIYPTRFTRLSYHRNEHPAYRFEFFDLPHNLTSGGTVYAKAYDVFGNSVTTPQHPYNCPSEHS